MAEHQALLLMSSWPEVQPATLLLSDSAPLLGLYRKVLCVVRSEEAGGRDLYSLLYPPGWCLLEDLEERHRSGQDPTNYHPQYYIPDGCGEMSAGSLELTV